MGCSRKPAQLQQQEWAGNLHCHFRQDLLPSRPLLCSPQKPLVCSVTPPFPALLTDWSLFIQGKPHNNVHFKQPYRILEAANLEDSGDREQNPALQMSSFHMLDCSGSFLCCSVEGDLPLSFLLFAIYSLIQITWKRGGKERCKAEAQQTNILVPVAKHTFVTVVSAIVGIAFTVGFPMLRNLTLPMVAFQNPARVRGIVLLLTVHACVAFHALTGVSNIGCHALTMQTPGERKVLRCWSSSSQECL